MEVIPSVESGELDVGALEHMLAKGGVKAVAITHIPTNGGVVNPAKEGINAERVDAIASCSLWSANRACGRQHTLAISRHIFTSSNGVNK